MSERKTDEIKFRVEPSVKARWQAAADREALGLSEFIRRAAEREANPIMVIDPGTSTFQTLLADGAMSAEKINISNREVEDPVVGGHEKFETTWKPFRSEREADSFA